jgi:hypothetical protein
MLKNIFALIALFILWSCSSLDSNHREGEEEMQTHKSWKLDVETIYKLKVQEKRDRGE